MVILKNIRNDGSTISADYYPEGNNKGFMSLDVLNGEIIDHVESSSFAAAHVKRELRKLIGKKDIPKEKTLLWY